MLGFKEKKEMVVNDLVLKHISNIIKILLDTNKKQNLRMENLEKMIENLSKENKI
tara:strand:+ start:936 stop:1100 length:165 start_codon:yes stop_codon:yes gene_type:complete